MAVLANITVECIGPNGTPYLTSPCRSNINIGQWFLKAHPIFGYRYPSVLNSHKIGY